MSIERAVKLPARTASMNCGSGKMGLHGQQGRIESFDVPDLQHRVAAARRGHQFVGFANAAGQRLFDQHVQAAIEKFQRDVVVRARRSGDDRRVDLFQQFVMVGDGRRCRRAATCWRASGIGSATPTSSTSSRSASSRAWMLPKCPAPTTATRNLLTRLSYVREPGRACLPAVAG